MADCIFCKLVEGKIPAQKVHDDARFCAFRDIHPQAPTHIVVIPKAHVETVNDAKAEHAALLGDLILTARDLAAREGLAKSGYRLVLNCNKDAGQTVFHIHLHLLGGRALGWPPG